MELCVTTLDILSNICMAVMGLIPPTEGQLIVDGQPIGDDSRRSWQRSIAHVPQAIYLADSSFAENIAFGIPKESINLDRVREAARQAKIADFIESRTDGYNRIVGERGVRISGGERQRIAIARALYKQASVLVFDEATSALDNATEQEIMETIESLDSQLTIILIAHRLTTVKKCDIIFEIANGKLVNQGTFDYLYKNSESFRILAGDSSKATGT